MNNYKYKVTGFIAFLVIIGLSSCRTSKNLSDLNKDPNGLFKENINATEDTTTIADIPWKEYFKDQKLQDLIAEGLSNNFDVKDAAERIYQAQVSLGMAKAAKLPTFGVEAYDSHFQTSTGTEGKKILGYSSEYYAMLGFTTSWEADIWGKLNKKKKAQYASFLNSQEYLLLTQTNLISGITNAYYNLLALDEQLQITRETVTLLQSSAETMQALKNAGQQNGAAVEQSNALLYSTQISIPDIETAIQKQENALCILIARKPGHIERSKIEEQQFPEELKIGVPAQLLSRRPDVLRAELSFRQAYELTKAAKASLYPSLTISSGFIGFYATSFEDYFKPENIALRLIGSLAQPIFNQKQLKGNLEIATSQQRQAAITFQNTLLSAGKEVSDLMYGYKASLSKNENRQKQIKSLTNAVDFTQDLLKAGEANYVEVLSAQQSLLSAKLSGVNDKLEQLDYCVSLYKALGGGTK